jgi:hypothetical protein
MHKPSPPSTGTPVKQTLSHHSGPNSATQATCSPLRVTNKRAQTSHNVDPHINGTESRNSDAGLNSNKPQRTNNSNIVSPSPSVAPQANQNQDAGEGDIDTASGTRQRGTGGGGSHRCGVEPFVKEAWDRALHEFQGHNRGGTHGGSPHGSGSKFGGDASSDGDDGRRRRPMGSSPSPLARHGSGRLNKQTHSVSMSINSARDDSRCHTTCHVSMSVY